MARIYRIGELARLSGVQVETVRYYEAQKLMPRPARSQGNYRQYTEDHLQTLSFIRHCRSLDMSMAEIRQLLRAKHSTSFDSTEVHAVLDRHIAHVAERLTQLRKLQQELIDLRSRCAGAQNAGECGILTGLAGPAPTPSSTTSSVHVVRRSSRRSRAS